MVNAVHHLIDATFWRIPRSLATSNSVVTIRNCTSYIIITRINTHNPRAWPCIRSFHCHSKKAGIPNQFHLCISYSKQNVIDLYGKRCEQSKKKKRNINIQKRRNTMNMPATSLFFSCRIINWQKSWHYSANASGKNTQVTIHINIHW